MSTGETFREELSDEAKALCRRFGLERRDYWGTVHKIGKLFRARKISANEAAEFGVHFEGVPAVEPKAKRKRIRGPSEAGAALLKELGQAPHLQRLSRGVVKHHIVAGMDDAAAKAMVAKLRQAKMITAAVAADFGVA